MGTAAFRPTNSSKSPLPLGAIVQLNDNRQQVVIMSDKAWQ